MLETSSLPLFVTASLLLIIAPGPDIIFLITQGVSGGPRAGLRTALGLACGNLIHTLGAALGISVIFRTSAVAFQIVKFAGVLYLLLLSWKTLRPPNQRPQTPSLPSASAENLVARGFLMNVLNPKVALFFLAFLPQFASPARGALWAQLLGYGVLFTALVMLVFGAVGWFAGAVTRWLHRGRAGAAAHCMKWLVAGVYAVLAARLALLTM